MQLESRDTQYRAAIRKKEVDYGRLQDSMRRAVQKDSRSSGGIGKGVRGIEVNFELSPCEASTAGGRAPLGGMLNEQARGRVEELEKENTSLRSMLVDLQVGAQWGWWVGTGGDVCVCVCVFLWRCFCFAKILYEPGRM